MTVKKGITVAVFLLIGVLMFFGIQEIFLPDWNVDNAEQTLSGFAALEENSVDVLFLGPSHVGKGIAPMKIYEDTGIRSYNLATSGQSVATSSFLLEHALQTQNPKAVLLDASSFFDRDIADKRVAGFYRYVMDNLYLTKTGWDMARTYEQITGNTGFLSAAIPMSLYHTRWQELTEDDFTEKPARPYYSMGLCVMPNTAPIDEDVQLVYNAHLDQLEDGEYAPEISAQAQTYFSKIQTLCRERDIALVLIKVPSIRSPYDSGWNSVKSGAIAQMAAESGVLFYDLSDLDLYDPRTDTSDGKHLNIRGAEKISAWIGAVLALRGVEPAEYPDEAFADALDIYRDVREVAMLQSETVFSDYLTRLAGNSARWSFAVAGHGDFVSGLTAEEITQLQGMGLMGEEIPGPTDTYAALFREGNVRYLEHSDRYISHSDGEDGTFLTVTSASKFDAAVEGRSTAIARNDNRAVGSEGLLFMVWDNETGLVIDSRSFATGTAEKTVSCSSGTVTGYLRNYEAAVMQ